VDGYTNLNKGIESLYKRVYEVLNNKDVKQVNEDNLKGIDQEFIDEYNSNESNAEKCSNCKTVLIEGSLVCYNCGEVNPYSKAKVNHQVGPSQDEPTEPINPFVAILIIAVIIFFSFYVFF
jgi:hypothetical protein